MDRTQALIDELRRARDGFFEALEATGAPIGPGLTGEWGARELVAHLGYWAGWAIEVIRAVEEGRVEELYAEKAPVDEVNATVARVARDAELVTVRKREAASVEALIDQLQRMDPSLLDASLPSGFPLEALIRDDGADHYREHADALRGPAGGATS